MFGRTLEEIQRTGCSGMVDPLDASTCLSTVLHEGIAKGSDLVEISLLRVNGGKFPAEVSSSCFVDENGTKKICIFIRDTTQRQEAEKNYRTLFREMLEGFAVHEILCDTEGNPVDYRFLDVNPAFEHMTGFRSEQIIGKKATEVFLHLERRWIDTYGRVALTGEPAFFESWSQDLGKIFEVAAYQPEPNKFACIFSDTTEKRSSIERMRKALGGTIYAIAAAVEARDPYTAGHQSRVADLAQAVAIEIGLPADMIEGLRLAATIHDLGKLTIPAEILTKPKKLLDIEYGLIKTHCQTGYEILKNIEFPWPIARIVLEHHERLDGSGYPKGLKGDQVLLESRILAVADVVEAMASFRPYRPALGIDAALGEIEKNRGILYDAAVADACRRLFREKAYAFPMN
jgi:PAS domain S-box-containing protein